jgi:RNA polymerase sigma-70 factor (ECF subfamily)
MAGDDPESRLVGRAKDGDEEAFGRLVRPGAQDLHAYLVRMTGRYDEARDLLQETWIRAWRALPGYEHAGRFSGWLFAIARNVALDALRSRRKVEPLGSEEILAHPDPGPLDEVAAGEFIEDLREALEGLPPERRNVFLLRQHTDLTFREIAGEMGIPLGTALSHMHHAVRQLREALEHHDG